MEVFPNLNVNKISDAYRAELDEKKVAIGQQVQYRLLGGRLNPDPEERRKKEIIWPQSEVILCRDRIKDPHTGKLIDIGVVKEIDENDKPIYAKKYINARESNGYFYVNGGNVEQERFYDFYECTNFNKSNPHRDKNVNPLFERVDAVKEAKQRNKNDDALTDMLALVKDADLAEKKEIASAYGWDINTDEEVITTRLREIVKKDPISFKAVVGNKADLAMKAVINEAIRGDVITYAPLENKYTFTKTEEVICTLTRNESIEPADQFLEWLKTNTAGKAVLKNIKAQLSIKQ